MPAAQLRTVTGFVWNPSPINSGNRQGVGATGSQCLRRAQRRHFLTEDDAIQQGPNDAAGCRQIQLNVLRSRPETAAALLPTVAAMIMAAGLCLSGAAVAATQGEVFESLGIEQPTAGTQSSVYQAKPKTKKAFITESSERPAPAIKSSLLSTPAAPPAPKAAPKPAVPPTPKPAPTAAVKPAPKPATKSSPVPPPKQPEKREIPKKQAQQAQKKPSPQNPSAQTKPKKPSTAPATPKSIQLKEPIRQSTQGFTAKGLEVPEPTVGQGGKLKFAPKPPKSAATKGTTKATTPSLSVAVPTVALESSTQAAIVGTLELALVAGALSVVSSSTKQ